MVTNNSKIPILQTKGIYKSFGHVQALENVDIDLFSSEVVALIGDNGAGKSTLIKIISGIYKKDSGEVFYKGEKVEINVPKDAVEKAGISTVYQDLALVEVQDVGVNIYLNIDTYVPIYMRRWTSSWRRAATHSSCLPYQTRSSMRPPANIRAIQK